MTDIARKGIVCLLHEVKRLAREASLSGALSGGSQLLIRTYNRCTALLAELDDERVQWVLGANIVPAELPADATVDELGISAALLLGVLASDADEQRREREVVLAGALPRLAQLRKQTSGTPQQDR
ncbi:MAG: hypothetical protein ACOX18_02655 [Bacillota bacterium]|jgi:hypothetical protein